ncbi:hypothetical protein [Syntrophorhabdus aromaticivorans]|uniref:Uncharacterized protein n=1 Tax=Syntrophorhabdus aromaticivorans TaxID=328301 RepID=A0A971M3F2_9BACT|nr:hypothetical protein [Syntrophorhabdus aromaticivorans]NLW34554.1 hypothetical protein [Syntrophorhabdus aromaticivorans]
MDFEKAGINPQDLNYRVAKNALQKSTLTDGSRAYSVFVRDAELPGKVRKTIDSTLKLVEMVDNFDII